MPQRLAMRRLQHDSVSMGAMTSNGARQYLEGVDMSKEEVASAEGKGAPEALVGMIQSPGPRALRLRSGRERAAGLPPEELAS